MKPSAFHSIPNLTTKGILLQPKKVETSSNEKIQSELFKQSDETVILKKIPSQEWINQQIKEVIHNINNAFYNKLEKTILDTAKILTKCYKLSETETDEMISNILNTKDENKKSPLFHAIKKQNIGNIQILYEYGAIIGQEEIKYAESLYLPSNPVIKILHKFEQFNLMEK